VIKDSIDLDQIPQGISLKRIKKRALSYAKQEAAQNKHLRKTIIIPLTAAIFTVCFGVFAITSDLWGLFFKNTELLEQNDAVSMIGESRYAGDYKITLEEAAFGDSTGIIMLSLERKDGGKLHNNIHLNLNIRPFNQIAGTQTSRLSEDGRKLFICQRIDLRDRDLPDTLEINIVEINSLPASNTTADWPLGRIYSEDFAEIIMKRDVARLDKMYRAAKDRAMEDIRIIDVLAACFVDDRLAVVYRDEPAKKKELNRTEFLMALYDDRSEKLVPKEDEERMIHDNGLNYFISFYSGIDEQDLDHLFPVAAYVSFEKPVSADVGFEVSTRSGLEEVEYTYGFHPTAETEGLEIESIKISPLGFVLTAVSDEPLDVSPAFARSDVYCLMEDGARVKVEPIGIASVRRTRFNLDFIVNDMLLDAKKVKAIYINDQLFWSKQ